MKSDLAKELFAAYNSCDAAGSHVSGLTGLDLDSAYLVEGEFRRLREAAGRRVVGRKAGYANKAMWRALKLDTLVWAHMYDDTVHYSHGGTAEFALGSLSEARLEPEVVFKLKDGPGTGLERAEWVAMGFEIIACPFPDWKFQPADFVAAYGLHRGLVVGEPVAVNSGNIAALTEQLAAFKLRLFRNDELIEEGAGRNSLRSPALCLEEFAGAVQRQSGCEPIQAGELFSSGTLTAAQPVGTGDVWRIELDGLEIPAIRLTISS